MPGRNLTEKEKTEHKRYLRLVNERMPKSKTAVQCLLAFLVGGTICLLGQFIGDIGELAFALDEKSRAAFTSITLIFIGALLTGLGVYDKVGTFAGAGSVVPITGFANSIVAPAMEHKREGYVLGVGAQMFSYAGPVLVYGITTSVIIGVISWLMHR
ncbi:MAG: stage V sporulation protein AC [Clostridia bacterium]|nr:stage V sporulation protein AC [Clostridia bacterium]